MPARTSPKKVHFHSTLLYGVNKTVLNKLQMVQNAAARLISLRRKRESVSDVLHNLHWLRVEARIVFKLLLLVKNVCMTWHRTILLS